jgi:hypothetical protein
VARGKKVPVIINFTALDKVSDPLRRLSQRLEATRAPVTRLQNSFQRFGKASGLTGFIGGMKSVISFVGKAAIGVAALGAAAFYAFNRFVGQSIEANDNLADLARNTGISAVAIQRWRYAAEQTGGTVEEMDDAFMKFSRSLGMARRGGGELVTLFGQQSPFLNQLTQFKSTEKAFEFFVSRISKIKDETEKIQVIRAIGKGNEGLLGLFNIDNGELSKLFKAKDEIGNLTDDQLQFFSQFDDQQKKVGQRFDYLRSKVISKFLPVFNNLLLKFDEWLTKNQVKLDRFATILADELPGALRETRDLLKPIVELMGLMVTHAETLRPWVKGGLFLGKMAVAPNPGKVLAEQAMQGEGVQGLMGLAKKWWNGSPAENATVPNPAPRSGGEAQVRVIFDNVPRGVRVTSQDKGFAGVLSTDVGMKMGPGM